MIALGMVALAVYVVVPSAGDRGRGRLAERDDYSLQTAHEQLAHGGSETLAVGYTAVALVVACVQQDFAMAAVQAAGFTIAILCVRAHPGALGNASAELEARSLPPKPQPPRSARRRRRTRQIGMGSLVLVGLGSLLLWLVPEGALGDGVAGVVLAVAIVCGLAYVVASGWVYGDEETDEPTRRT